ncbi:hypothetical protein LRS06_02385 [Hymenobacter sp. J193]|uniref:hypothetical protein n=1 Tax=Hymenobacter sp. J193 TaxID=2898429 RepID=UPI0021516705|nr:hypothetical protein [Hymenobacter sp. J193]MCR5886640.1 hypothetical protein [Hymenobacter sp. J193]
MKTCYPTLLLLLLLLGTIARAQTTPATGSVGIGTSTPDAKAALDISSTDKGLLIPRLDSVQRAGIAAPPDGLMVFQTDGRQGFWYALGGQWLYIPDKTKAGDNLGNHAASQHLGLRDFDLRLREASDGNHGLGWYGNSNSPKNWLSQTVDGPVLYGYGGGVLGTADGSSPRSVLTWTNAGRVGIGLNSPTLPLDVSAALGLRNAASWDHLYFSHDGSTALVNAGGAESGLALRVGTGSTGSYGDQPYNEVMRLRANGRVGIGTNDPQQTLDVNGTAQADAFAYRTAQTRYLTVSAAAFISAAPHVYDTNVTIGPATGSP